MEFTLQTPALIFPAISLLMLAYTNRFLTLAGLVRDLTKVHVEEKDPNILEQIRNLQKRMTYIRKMQLWGALSFTLAVISMLMLLIDFPYSLMVFAVSLACLLISLAYLVLELNISIHALTLQLDKIKEENESTH